MMIGGGGNNCAGADHGIGITEANKASFIDGDSSGRAKDNSEYDWL